MHQFNFSSRVALSDFGIAGEGSVAGFLPELLEPSLRPFIPAKDTQYVFRAESLFTFSSWWEFGRREPLLVSGPHGAGKTSFVEQFFARVGAPVISMTAHARLERSDLIGHYVIGRDKSMRFVDGPLTRAYRHGCAFLVNEMSAAPAEFWLSLNELLEGSPLFIEATGEVVPRHPDCCIVMTDNTRGLDDSEHDVYIGRHLQDAAVMDRCWKMRITYMEREEELRLLLDSMPEVSVFGMESAVWARAFAERLRRAAERVREAADTQGDAGLTATLSTRTLLRLRDLILLAYRSGTFPKREALTWATRTAFTECLDTPTALTIEKLIEAELGDIVAFVSDAHR
jgi:cobaltochelatase CobS